MYADGADEMRRSNTSSNSTNEVVNSNQNKKGMVLPFVPLSITFDDIRYSVDMPQVISRQYILSFFKKRKIILEKTTSIFYFISLVKFVVDFHCSLKKKKKKNDKQY